jgi:hypothetical protein
MTRAGLALAIVLAACGDNTAPHADAAPAGCVAVFTGNFTETSSPDACATVASGSLQLMVPTTTLGTTLAATFALGEAPTSGTYAPETIAAWAARADQRIGNGICVYSAGSAVVPHGSFELQLDAIDAAAGTAHGTLALVQYVLVFPSTECGQADTEHVDVRF